ncbi:MAG: InlB B-repeat-containing protein [Lachnospiraceae bacterium]|nr:InlB B-repeat-containing protein [Lachnospiraceae bacterium]
MKKFAKLFLSLMLVLVLTVCAFGGMTFAEPDQTQVKPTVVKTFDELKAAVANGGAIELGADIALTSNLYCRKEMTVDLKGHILNVSGKTIVIQNKVILKDTTEEKKGKITGTAKNMIQVGSTKTEGELTVESGTVEGVKDYGIMIFAKGKFKNNGGVVKATTYTVNEKGFIETKAKEATADKKADDGQKADGDKAGTQDADSKADQKSDDPEKVDDAAEAHSVEIIIIGDGEAKAEPESEEPEKEVKLTATPKIGSQFKKWEVVSGDVQLKDANAAETTFVMGSDDVKIKVTFEVIKYTIKFVNDDGKQLQSSKVAYGDTPNYEGATPTKAATSKYTYKFKGWSPAVAKVTADATYKATYTATAVPEKKEETTPAKTTATLTFDLAGGTMDGKTGKVTMTATIGSKIKIPSTKPTRTGYIFRYWKGSFYHPGDEYEVKEDHTFTAVWGKRSSTTKSSSTTKTSSARTTKSANSTNSKKAGSVKTGDDQRVLIWTIVLLASLAVLVEMKLRSGSKRRS